MQSAVLLSTANGNAIKCKTVNAKANSNAIQVNTKKLCFLPMPLISQ